MEAPETIIPALANETPAEATLVWIDAAKATIIRWTDGHADTTHMESEVPDHRRATGRKRRQPRHEAAVRMGGAGPSLITGGFGHPNPDDDSHRAEHLRRFVAEVAGQLDGDEHLLIVGTGTVREQLDRAVRERDQHQRRARAVACEASDLMSERQMVARLREWAGDPPRRRTTGAYRWTGEPPTKSSGATVAAPGRVATKPPRTRELLEEALDADLAAELATETATETGRTTDASGADPGTLATSQLAADIGESAPEPREAPGGDVDDGTVEQASDEADDKAPV
jgi:hypothetical protein